MGTQERPKEKSRHTLEAIFLEMRVVVEYRRGQKQSGKIVQHPKSTLAGPPIYDQAQPEMLSAVSQGNLVSIMERSSLLLFVQHEQNFWKESKNIKDTFF